MPRLPHSERAWRLIRTRQARARRNPEYRERLQRYRIREPHRDTPRWKSPRLALRGTHRTLGMRRKLQRVWRSVPDAVLRAADDTVGAEAARLAETLPVATGLTGATVALEYDANGNRFAATLEVRSPYASTIDEARRISVSRSRARRAVGRRVKQSARRRGR